MSLVSAHHDPDAMVSPADFWDALIDSGYTFFSGVPCSIITNTLRHADSHPGIEYVPAVRENAALGIASGAWMAGRKSGILIQNSGLGNIVNALTSFNSIYHVPVLMFITWRGYEGKDAPEHIVMGAEMLRLLDLIGIPALVMGESHRQDLAGAISLLEETRRPVAIILKRGVVS